MLPANKLSYTKRIAKKHRLLNRSPEMNKGNNDIKRKMLNMGYYESKNLGI